MTSKIKVDNINKVSDDSNIIKKCGSTITLGASGDSIALASGASQTGFGRTGTVDWQTSSIKTATFTAANGEGYFANTSSGGFTMNLPAGSAGNIVSVVDYTNTFQTNSLTIAPNGTDKIGGVNASVPLSTEGQSVTFVFVDSTEGWKNVQDSTSNVTGNENIIASGGTETTSGNFKIHTFTGPGTFTVSNASSTAANNIASYMVVAGGASGGSSEGGGGGAGGFREYKGPVDSYTASPLNGNPCGTAVTLTAQAYPITVGAGGATVGPSPSSNGNLGSNSIFSTITSAGGGGGGSNASPGNGLSGGSGGGSRRDANQPCAAAGNTPPVTPPQGNNGGSTPSCNWHGSGGGGGATAVGVNGTGNGSPSGEDGGNGGAGATTSITASPVAYAGGGGGSINGTSGDIGSGGAGGGGNGSQPPAAATAGTTNTGGGGGGGTGKASGAGGSGIVIIRYKFQ
jgi:hypothetical protein